ncbi:MAG: imidazole glycerol phosphate synthase subunit HisH [Eubacteriales bacterium]
MTAVVDYGVGNLYSLHSSLGFIGEDAVVSSDARVIEKADRIILPGVGAFGDAAAKLHESGLDGVLCELARQGKPLMGICLGMQLLFERGYEFGEHRGLGLVPGEVRYIGEVIPEGLKIPHIGWNSLDFVGGRDPIFRNINNGDFVYFVHSYYATECEGSVIATAEYGAPLTAAVRRGNVYGMQFHPEKSGRVGLGILKAFCEI